MKEKIIKTKVGQLFVSYQPSEKIAVFLSGAGSLPTYENFCQSFGSYLKIGAI